MTLKFDIHGDSGGYELQIDTDQTVIQVAATEPELRRLLIDLTHEVGIDE